MNKKYLSIYLVFIFHSSEFCSFPHSDPVHILLDFIPKYFIFGDANVNSIMFLIANSTCSLLIYSKVIDFFILTLYPANLL